MIEGTVRENMCYGCRQDISDEKLLEIAKLSRVYDFVSKLPDKFETHVALGGANFSGGQRQCIAIARAMLNDPKYLLLDEATSNLDAQNEHAVLDALKELMKGRTTVIIAHSLASIRHADHVIVLHNGKVESMGAPAMISVSYTHQMCIRDSNYPGLGIVSGSKMLECFTNHLMEMNIGVTDKHVTEISKVGDHFQILCGVETWEAYAVIPVSYTHLDVYKRQGQGHRPAAADGFHVRFQLRQRHHVQRGR